MKTILNALGNPIKEVVNNSKGEPIILNAREQRMADSIERRIKNDLGFDIPITTMTTLVKKITEQKFYTIPFADYLPVRVGQGAWSDNLLTFREFTMGDNFEDGYVNMGQESDRLSSADAGIDSVTVANNDWAKKITWTLMQIQKAIKAGNWDIVTSKEKARKKNWDLGIQRIAFLGARGESTKRIPGLLTMPGVTINTTTITKKISSMTVTELKTMVSTIVGDYRKNSQFTAWPKVFIVPEDDYTGMVGPASADFPFNSVLEYLNKAFKEAIPGFQSIMPLAYAIDTQNPSNKHIYTMHSMDDEALRMDIPVDYTTTVPNSIDNFSLQNVGYGEHTGAFPYRPREIMYWTF